jgi:site-specific DNA-methyltransferase (adenine-specific)
MTDFTFDYDAKTIGRSTLIHADSLEWLSRIPVASVHAVVTDPPYGVKEFEPEQLEKRKNGNGGIWRIPPTFDGSTRAPLPRFTALTPKELETLTAFFSTWAKLVARALKPGGHLLVASNAYLSQLVFSSVANDDLEFRGEVIRLVKTLRGGDRPKNAEQEFPNVCSLPRGGYEPWGLFRKKLPDGMTVSECLRVHQTGGLRRKPDGKPFEDVIPSTRTPKAERDIANHPSLKPQEFLRQVVYAVLPLGEGIVVDPFMGSGSTVAAAESLGYAAIGIEKYRDYYDLSLNAVPRLKAIQTRFGQATQLELPLE